MSEVKTAKVKKVRSIRERNLGGEKGVIFYITLEMDNGDIGEIGKKKRDAFKPGDSLSYTISKTGDNGQFTNFVEHRPNSYGGRGGGGFSAPRIEAMALSYGKDIIVARIASGACKDMTKEQIRDAVQWFGKEFLAWLKDHNTHA